MKEWKFIELDDSYGFGVTEDGFEFVETEVQGWNDDVDFSDLTTLITLRAVNYAHEVKVYQEYSHPEIRSNVTAMKLAKEAINDLVDQL
ncbi:hypothetical protein HF394_19975 (plasmid) [Planococcus glaciei]|uniref:Phage ABA sandwich domain-containing protein n=1 Tax=Planococcus glaciei TaxID=459472 RepID=A0A518XRV8_9BACL|nr:hypothetical protein [Planococcus glaciei]QDY46943.1 hypothetical protein FK545_20270 [Planococcus glaciei]QDY47024.1 hypothetical protein FK545_20855 [Planococcus glaciei]QKX52807.1 hypothetical protein HF394_19440 [Planococcus glaciei]QKX52907.1 hypothetical protein HF394_19975 [Planococcus glaciei]